MTHYIIVENGKRGQYRARVLGWPETVVQGTSRQEVLTMIRQRIAERLAQVEIVPFEIESTSLSGHPWMKFAGMFEDEPMFEQVLEDIQEYRKELDANEQVP